MMAHISQQQNTAELYSRYFSLCAPGEKRRRRRGAGWKNKMGRRQKSKVELRNPDE